MELGVVYLVFAMMHLVFRMVHLVPFAFAQGKNGVNLTKFYTNNVCDKYELCPSQPVQMAEFIL